MTSYATANESSSTTTATSAAAAVTANVNEAASAVVVQSPAIPAPTITTDPLDFHHNSSKSSTDAEFVISSKCLPLQPLDLSASSTGTNRSHYDCDYDCDSSMSDGREKADTTPENIKKIDDIIDDEQQRRSATAASNYHKYFERSDVSPNHQQQQQPHFGFDPCYGGTVVGLASALDDSNAKFCLANPLVSGAKDTFCKSERSVDSSNSNSTPVTPNNNNNNNSQNNNNSNNNSKSANTNNCCADDDDSSASNTTTTTTTNTNKQQSYAFTIDNFNDKDCDREAAAAKYKTMMERFQNRHRRGASMSKLECGIGGEDTNEATGKPTKETSTGTGNNSAVASPLTMRTTRSNSRTDSPHNNIVATRDAEAAENAFKVKLRVRDRSTSRVRDSAKRHSWSPRSSTQELSTSTSAKTANTRKTAAAATVKPKAAPPPPLHLPKGASNLLANRTQFTPRSAAMQMALQKVDFLCPQPPLADFKHLQLQDGDNISEAGTYTLDGDNYTEEQKDLMNIDERRAAQQKMRPKDLHLHSAAESAVAAVTASSTAVAATKIPRHINNRNVLEVNYYHEATPTSAELDEKLNANDFLLGSHQSAGAYLQKIKSRVLRNMSATKNAPVLENQSDAAMYAAARQCVQPSQVAEKATVSADDMGCFTSVTTSGVLAKQSALDPRPKLTRRSSLSTSQIDSSEYISNEAKLKSTSAAVYAAGGFTDHQKAEYRLNVFTNQKDTQKFAATRNLIESPPETPPQMSDAALLKTAQTKNDWIQEWARNARARSLANDTTPANSTKSSGRHAAAPHDPMALMTRSYTCASESLTDDSIYREKYAAAAPSMSSGKLLNRTLAERYRLAGGDCDYASDPSLYAIAKTSQQDLSGNGAYKPPKSPSKIPSPLHSLGRTRSASRTRASLQNMLIHGDEEDDADMDAAMYLQKTAAAISSLSQSLSRKNSLKSPTHSASPRAHSARIEYADEYSPQHSIELASPSASGYYHARSPLHQQQQQHQQNHHHHHHNAHQHHRRNVAQLMTSSINEQQLQLLTSGEYLAKQMRLRKNSFDGNASQNSPVRRVPQTSPPQQSLSPLRRSSSFSTKIAGGAPPPQTTRAARPQYQNIYTPPALRHNYTLAAANTSNSQQNIKKSASSNNFRQVYSDYDDNLAYYINDADDAAEDEYYSSGAEAEDDYASTPIADETPSAPLSNTRYNKALLMRIERSKQKVAGKPASAPAAHAAKATANAGGLNACPNTPELPRRGIKSAPHRSGGNARQSMPRDNSLSRLAQQVPSSLASAKKQLLQTAAATKTSATPLSNATAAGAPNQRVQPKYLDISKYKPAQGNNFLRKNDAKSTLKPMPPAADNMKRSPSSSSMGLSRADATRASNRSVRSVASCMTTSGNSLNSGRASSAVRRDASVAKQKEAEMAMWKRRSTYDPMKAAAEDRRKKEEAKKMTQVKNMDNDMSNDMVSESAHDDDDMDDMQQQWSPLGEHEYDDDVDDIEEESEQF